MKRYNYFKFLVIILMLIFMTGCGASTITTPSKPVINSFTASPLAITAGGSSTLSWNVSDATSVSIDQGVGSGLALSSSASVSPTTTTTYTLTATNTAGTVTASVQVTVSTTTYTVTFKSQGGSAVISQVVGDGGLVTEPTAPTKAGYTFGGWYKEFWCTNAWNFATDTVTSDIMLYAQWIRDTANPTYTVTYNGNGSTGGTVPVDSSSPYEYGATVTVLGQGSLVKSGYIFWGWCTAADGSGTSHFAGFTFNMGSGNVTLYALWTPTYTLTIAVNPTGGGTTDPAVGAHPGCPENLLVSISATPTTGYHFVKWSGDVTGSANPTTVTLDANKTVTANFELVIGASYGGGIVFYILQSGDPGYDANVQHGLIAATTDQSTGIQWFNGTYVQTGCTATYIGTGQFNTTTIVNVQGAGSYATKLCNDLTLNGYNDWFLPSKDELNELYLNRGVIGGFASSYYWSSSEDVAKYAWGQYFGSGGQDTYKTFNTFRVRAVRAF